MSPSEFSLDPRLANDSRPVCELKLCSLRLMNESRYPWLLLVPRRAACVEVFDLDPGDQLTLWQEAARVGELLKTVCAADKINVAALGNVVAQLHVHVIARLRDDAAWPDPVWGRHPSLPRVENVDPEWLPDLIDGLAGNRV